MSISTKQEADRSSLRELFELERQQLVRLERLLDHERAAAASYQLKAMLACLGEREAIQSEWQRVAEARRRCLRECRESLAVLAARDPELKATIAAARREAAAVRRAQRVNRGLIRAALAQVSDLLTVIRRGLPESRYDRRAALNSPLPRSSGGWSA